ncbi:hypothetical protein C8F01DRAFT_984957 [Mycena amicta]|nr:hypothetical protein C8F01DRAFT_984957 [Mycena amicta]
MSALAVIIFPLLSALALKQTAGNAVASGLLSHIEKQCPPTDSPLCAVVAFFHLAFTPEVRPLLHYFLSTALPLLAIPSLEAARPGRRALLALPIIYGLCMQLFTAGVVLPLYWLVFILTGAHKRRPPSAISSRYAQAILFGLFVGVAVPSACLITLQKEKVTAFWQLFPLWQFLAQKAHLLFRPPGAHQSGFTWVQTLYVAAFIVASFTHINAIFVGKNDLNAVFVPSIAPRVGASPTLHVLDLLQWDIAFAFGSTLLGTVWFARTRRDVGYIVLWNILASIVVGPGAAVAAVALWRESQLHTR